MEGARPARSDVLKLVVWCAALAACGASYWLAPRAAVVVPAWMDAHNQQGIRVNVDPAPYCSREERAAERCRSAGGSGSDACTLEMLKLTSCTTTMTEAEEALNEQCRDEIFEWANCQQGQPSECDEVIAAVTECHNAIVAKYVEIRAQRLDAFP